ncbi:hypothetical protein DXG01_004450, partial [Tephrocybe rancida]
MLRPSVGYTELRHTLILSAHRVLFPTARVDDWMRRNSVESARAFIYAQDLGVNSKAVEGLLKENSWVPVANAFSERLARFGFNFFQMLVVDILHDWEIGAWKAVFIHLIRILYATDAALVNELDAR